MNALLRPARVALLAAVAGAAAPAPAEATTMAALTLDDLAIRATDIVQGTVTELTPRWSDGFLLTDVTIEVETCIKGACLADSVQVQVFGGTSDGYVVEAAGSARYVPGEHVLLFLEPVGGSGQPRLRTAGMALGKFHVALAGDLPVVERSLEGLELLGPAREVAVAESRLALDELERRIATALAL